jgi:CBS domain-containing protein
VSEQALVIDAVMQMRTHNVSGLPVIGARGEVVGVLSQKDVARVVVGSPTFPEIQGLLDVLLVGLADQPAAALVRQRSALERTQVRELMSSPPVLIRSDAPLAAAARSMRERSINRLPVVDDGRLVGVVARSDLLRALVPHAAGSPRPRSGSRAG